MASTLKDSKQIAWDLFAERFGGAPSVFSRAPGRVELAGNHTDHQGGRTISAAINRYMYAYATPNNTDEIVVAMDDFGEAKISCADLSPREDEFETSAAIIRGMAAARVHAGQPLLGFNMAMASDIPSGGGLSSSAALEMLVGITMRALFDEVEVSLGNEAKRSPSNEDKSSHGENVSRETFAANLALGGLTLSDLCELAMQGVHTEQTFFGKPCGAQDQLACAIGGIIAIDFSEEMPSVTPINFNLEEAGYSLCLIDSACNHSKYPDEFAAIPADMRNVAHFFDASRLCEISERDFLDNLTSVRAALGDRKVLRALHYFEETGRVAVQKEALSAGDFQKFLECVRASGASSAQFLQNVSPNSPNTDGTQSYQPAMVILALCAHLLGRAGAYRIHGGGFGGSVLAFVPTEKLGDFVKRMDELCGYPACIPVGISPIGAYAERLA